MDHSLYDMGWVVLVYSVLGWLVEGLVVAVKEKAFVNRGFLTGPLCPVYGLGALLALLLLEPVKERLPLLFLGCMLLGTLLEFLAGFLLERLYKDKWWDHAAAPLNIKGYVCLGTSVVWGLAGVLVVAVLDPVLMGLVDKISYGLGMWLLIAAYVIMAGDLAVSLWVLPGLPRRFDTAMEAKNILAGKSDTPWESHIFRRVKVKEEQPNEAEGPGVEEPQTETEEKPTETAELKFWPMLVNLYVARHVALAYPKLADGKNSGHCFFRLRIICQVLTTKKGGSYD